MALEPGTEAPDFTLQNSEGERVSLTDYTAEKNVVLLFFPLAFSGICTKELCTIRDSMKLYESLNAQVLGISVDSFFTLKEFKKSENLNFPLLSDFNKEVSEKYEALYDDYYGMKGVSKRAAYIIDTESTIRYTEVLEDSGSLPNFDAIQKSLQELTN